jgi:hypothetical protein
MKCTDFEACMTDLLNGSLEEPEHREALEHALACDKCESLLHEQQRLDLELKTLAAGELSGQAPPELEQRLTAAFRDHSESVGVPYPCFFTALQKFSPETGNGNTPQPLSVWRSVFSQPGIY